MTREKAIEKAMILDVQGGYAVELVTKIYDELESRICENCVGFKSIDYCSIIDGDCSMILEYCNGCNKFEKKEI